MRQRNPFNPVPHKNRDVLPEQAECVGINQLFYHRSISSVMHRAQTTMVMGPAGQHATGPCHSYSVATTRKSFKILFCIPGKVTAYIHKHTLQQIRAEQI